MATFGQIYKKYAGREIKLPFEQCIFCENIEDCPHPEVDNNGKAICPDESKRKDEIILTKR